MGPAGKGGAGQLITQTLIILGGLGVGRVIYDADPVSRGRRHRDAVTDLSLEYSGIQLFRRLLGDQAVSGDIGVDGQNIKGGRSVDDDEIISVLEL